MAPPPPAPPLSQSLPPMLSLISTQPPHLASACLATLLTLHTNLLAHPGDAKYTRVRASSGAFKSVVEAKGTEVLTKTGWRKSVEDFEEIWRYHPLPDAAAEKEKLETDVRLIKSAKEGAEIAVQKAKERAQRAKETGKEELERVRREIENDRLDRKDREEREKMKRTAVAGTAATSGRGSPSKPGKGA